MSWAAPFLSLRVPRVQRAAVVGMCVCVSAPWRQRDRDSLLTAAPPRCPPKMFWKTARPAPLSSPSHRTMSCPSARLHLACGRHSSPSRGLHRERRGADHCSVAARKARLGRGLWRPAPRSSSLPAPHLPPRALMHATSPVSPSLASPVPLTPLVLSAVPAPVAERGGHPLWALPAQPRAAVPRGHLLPRRCTAPLLRSPALDAPARA